MSGASIKGLIKMKSVFEEESDEEEVEEVKEEEAKGNEKDEFLEGENPRWERIINLLNEIKEEYPFNILAEPNGDEYLRILNDDFQTYKIRVYLVTAQNLTATGVMIDLKSRLAGMTALSNANPYPVITVGEGKNDMDTGQKKKESERDNFVAGDLNPQFFKTWELDAQLPEDWKLEVAIWDRGMIEYTDSLIGSTIIDLENRHYGNTLWLQRHAIVTEIAKVKADLKLAKKKKKKTKEDKEFINQLKKR